MKGFASDNYATVHPDALAAIAAANDGHEPSYGADRYTAHAEQLFREHFGDSAQAYMVFNGTAANVLAMRAVCDPWGGVICTDTAHVNGDEGGAPEAIAGVKLFTAASPDGKLTPDQVEARLGRLGDVHQAQPQLVSIAQSTELGTTYQPGEIAALSAVAHRHGLRLHLDGARLCQAAAALGVPFRALTTDVGVDVVSFGGTKVGMLGAEAVVFLEPSLADGFLFLRKQSLQLASKGRFIAAQFEALLQNDLWQRLGAHANAMAARLAAAVGDVPGLTVTQPVQANAVFATLPAAATLALQADWRFYVWNETTGEVRWMCSWDTTPDEVDAFAAAIREQLGSRLTD
jgi:threonine aldolase